MTRKPTGLGGVPKFPPLPTGQPGARSPKGPVAVTRLARMLSPSMAEEMPPPYEPPLAPSADPKLVTFLYLMMRDMIPIGYVESTVSRALRETGEMGSNPELAAYAQRVARTLTYDRSLHLVHATDGTGKIPSSPTSQEA
jgi:hypothetical protein